MSNAGRFGTWGVMKDRTLIETKFKKRRYVLRYRAAAWDCMHFES